MSTNFTTTHTDDRIIEDLDDDYVAELHDRIGVRLATQDNAENGYTLLVDDRHVDGALILQRDLLGVATVYFTGNGVTYSFSSLRLAALWAAAYLGA